MFLFKKSLFIDVDLGEDIVTTDTTMAIITPEETSTLIMTTVIYSIFTMIKNMYIIFSLLILKGHHFNSATID